jgi:acetylornithine deacetylase/succinyl-diaminopimelate desuccinylase-like protein
MAAPAQSNAVIAEPEPSVDHLREDNLVAWLQRFVRFPSEQSDQHERDPQIRRFIRECAAPLAQEIGASCRYDKMGNLIIEVGPPSEGSLLFVAYAMTHPRGKMTDPFAATVIDTPRGRAVRGRGVAEQKTALAALYGALGKAIAGRMLKRRLSIVVLTAGETGRHDAITSVMPELECQPSLAIVCIGTDSRIAIGNKGRIDFDVIINGKTSHSSAPWHGVNAIAGAQRLLPALEGLQLGVPDHPQFGPATLTPTAIDSAPKATHTVPDTVRITYDRRLLPGEDPQAAFEAIRRVVTLPPPWSVECALGPVMYPNETATDGTLMEALRAAYAAAGAPNPEHFYCNFALDAGFLARAGIEAVMLGPGEVDQFHSSEESVLVADLSRMANVYYRLIEQCLGHNG